MIDFDGQVAVVTGGGRGLGRPFALEHFGRVDALIHSAGVFELLPFEDLTLGQWNRMLDVHLDGTFHVGQPADRAMKGQCYGRIVLVSSNVGAFGQAGATHYGAAKGGLIGLCNSLANSRQVPSSSR